MTRQCDRDYGITASTTGTDMGREGKEERRIKRAGEELATLQRRGDLAGMLSTLLKLPALWREPHLEPIGGLVRNRLALSFAARNWADLARLSLLVEREPRLLTAGPGTPDEVHEAHWALLWGCVHQGDWDRAGRFFAACRETIPQAQVTAALAALIESRGTPGETAMEAIAGAALTVARLTDVSRLGYDPGQERTRVASGLPPPASPEDVEPRLMAAFTRMGWGGFAATVEKWCRNADHAVARPMRILAARLAVRELVTRAAEAPLRVSEPAMFIVNEYLDAGCAAEIEAELLLALRAATAALSAKEPATREAARLYAGVARAAIRSPVLFPLVAGTVESTHFSHDARVHVLELLHDIFEREASTALWFKACALWGLPGEPGDLPAWLVSGLSRLLDRGDELRAVMQKASPRAVGAALDAIAIYFPPALAGRALDRLWNEASPAWCGDLARAFAMLLERVRKADAAPRGRAPSGVHRMLRQMLEENGGGDITEAELDEILASPEGKAMLRKVWTLAGLENDARLPAAALPLWRQFRDRVVPHSVELLEVALANSASITESNEVVLNFAGRHDGAVKLLEACRRAALHDCPHAVTALDDLLFARHARDPESMARCLLRARNRGAAPLLKRRLARALVDAVRNMPPGASMSGTVAEGLVEARLWDRRRSVKPKAVKKPGKRSKQLELGIPGPKPAGSDVQ